MATLFRRFGKALLVCGLLPTPGIEAQDKDPADAKPAAVAASKVASQKWAALFRRQAGDYVVQGDGGKAEMVAEPVLRWAQPVRGTEDGAVYLWLRQGRPEAAGALFTIKDGQGERALVHEFHALAPGAVTAQWRGQPAWSSASPSLERKPVPGAPIPGETPQARLRQMQAIAREFSANTVDRRNSPWELRLLARPIYRYDGSNPEVPDGALFAMVEGNDPEVLLILEAAKAGAGLEWRFAVAIYTDLELHVRHKGVEVLNTPLATQLEGRTGPHVGYTIEKRRSDDADDYDRP